MCRTFCRAILFLQIRLFCWHSLGVFAIFVCTGLAVQAVEDEEHHAVDHEGNVSDEDFAYELHEDGVAHHIGGGIGGKVEVEGYAEALDHKPYGPHEEVDECASIPPAADSDVVKAAHVDGGTGNGKVQAAQDDDEAKDACHPQIVRGDESSDERHDEAEEGIEEHPPPILGTAGTDLENK